MISLKDIEYLKDYIIHYRETFHKHPEVGFNEIETTKILKQILEDLNYKIEKNPLKTGVIATLNSDYVQTLMLRADIDALMMQEENDVPYKSQRDGIMHACGHDAHMAMLIGAARYFSENKSHIKGRIKLVFQPAEEGPLPGGAHHLVNHGIMADVDAVFGIHITTMYETGHVHIKSGEAMAAPDEFKIIIKGKGTHASAPESGNDVILVASMIIQAFQTIVSRELSANDKAVISVSTIHGGTTFNVLPDDCTMTGTIRTFTKENRSYIHRRMKEITTSISTLYDTQTEINIIEGYPPLINNKEMTENIINVATHSLGSQHVHVDDNPSMGGEDFAYYLQKKPGSFYWLGGRSKDQHTIYYNHNPKFDIDKNSLLYGTLLHINTVLDYFDKNSKRKN